MAIKVNDVIDHRYWGQGVVTEIGKEANRAGTIRARFVTCGTDDWHPRAHWHLWVLIDDCDVIVNN